MEALNNPNKPIKSIVIILFFFVAHFSSAETMLLPGMKWESLAYHVHYADAWKVIETSVGKDTIVNGIQYVQLFTKFDGNKQFSGCCERFFDGKLYLYICDDNIRTSIQQEFQSFFQEEELLVFDTSARVGDSSLYGKITSINDSLIFGISRKCWKGVDELGIEKLIWMDGIGSPADGILPNLVLDSRVHVIMTCTNIENEELYSNEVAVQKHKSLSTEMDWKKKETIAITGITYYTMEGVETVSPAKGYYIARFIYDNGAVKYLKMKK